MKGVSYIIINIFIDKGCFINIFIDIFTNIRQPLVTGFLVTGCFYKRPLLYYIIDLIGLASILRIATLLVSLLPELSDYK
jgi:hypothetical protein